mgnify:CR=1 FL=1
MAKFSGKIKSTKFVDTSEKTIEVLYEEGTDNLMVFFVPIDYTNQDFLDLMDEITLEDVQDYTRLYFESQSQAKHKAIEQAAKDMLAVWLVDIQKEIDEQVTRRFEEADEYKSQQMALLQSEMSDEIEKRFAEVDEYKIKQTRILQTEVDAQVESRFAEVDEYKLEQTKNLQTELDEQVERRVAEGYIKVDEYKAEQTRILQAEVDAQIESRYDEVALYKEQQLKILEDEISLQVESRFGEVDEYKEEQIKILQAEIDEQVKVRYEEADQYKIEQLKVLQSEIDQQVVARYDEADQYRDSQITQVKAEMYKKFNMSVPTVNPVTPKNVADFIINNFEDEDTVFKTKLAIFDLPEVKNSPSREMKMKVRKAKSIPQLFAAYNEIQHSNS